MSATQGAVITIFEKMLVPGDYVRLEKLWESNYWLGPRRKEEGPSPILQFTPEQKVAKPGMEIGTDPHKETINKISQALGGLMRKQQAIPTAQLVQPRDWR